MKYLSKTGFSCRQLWFATRWPRQCQPGDLFTQNRSFCTLWCTRYVMPRIFLKTIQPRLTKYFCLIGIAVNFVYDEKTKEDLQIIESTFKRPIKELRVHNNIRLISIYDMLTMTFVASTFRWRSSSLWILCWSRSNTNSGRNKSVPI